MSIPSADQLKTLYVSNKFSALDIAKNFSCSERKINYWLAKYDIQKRTLSEAMYVKYNPAGDPFTRPDIQNIEDALLYGLGLGLYWGEGNRMNKNSVRLGNTDPALVRKFIDFLIKIYKIDVRRLKFGLQIFSDMSPRKALAFWRKHLRARPDQFYKVTITPARSIGTYRNKTKHGVLTIYFCNTKLRNLICGEIENMR